MTADVKGGACNEESGSLSETCHHISNKVILLHLISPRLSYSDPLLFSRWLARLSRYHCGIFLSSSDFCPRVCMSVCLVLISSFLLPIALSGLIFSFLSYSQAFSSSSPSLLLGLCLSLIPVCLPSFFSPLWLLSLSLDFSLFLSGLRPLIACLSVWRLSLSLSFPLSRSDFWLCYNAAGWHRGNFFPLSSAVCFVCFVYCGNWEVDELICRPGWCMSGR